MSEMERLHRLIESARADREYEQRKAWELDRKAADDTARVVLGAGAAACLTWETSDDRGMTRAPLPGCAYLVFDRATEMLPHSDRGEYVAGGLRIVRCGGYGEGPTLQSLMDLESAFEACDECGAGLADE